MIVEIRDFMKSSKIFFLLDFLFFLASLFKKSSRFFKKIRLFDFFAVDVVAVMAHLSPPRSGALLPE